MGRTGLVRHIGLMVEMFRRQSLMGGLTDQVGQLQSCKKPTKYGTLPTLPTFFTTVWWASKTRPTLRGAGCTEKTARDGTSPSRRRFGPRRFDRTWWGNLKWSSWRSLPTSHLQKAYEKRNLANLVNFFSMFSVGRRSGERVVLRE